VLHELPVLSSSHGLLDLLMVARAAPVPTLTPFKPTGWVYDICPRPANGALNCPPSTANLYGGTRLQLQPGDTLKVRLVNKLPPVHDADHANDPGGAFLALNPTNIHTHGLLVSPRFPTVAEPTYGDNVFVLTLNPANGAPPADSHLHGDVRLGYTDYKIVLPASHPSGMYWFHPHVHGIALNQVSAGLAGMITVGDVRDYVCTGAACERFAARLPVRHLLLKDMQILASGRLQDQPDPVFCDWQAAPGEAPRQGACPGANAALNDPTAPDYSGGKWFLSVNGQPYPSVPVNAATGEIWRITSASGSTAYDLHLQNDAAPGTDMVVQVLSIDGVAVQGPTQGPMADWAARHRRRGHFSACPNINYTRMAPGASTPVCATSLFMMPSSRVELWVAYRDAAGRLSAPPAGGARAVLRTVGVDTGPAGDQWPAADLAAVHFLPGPPAPDQPAVLSIAHTAAGTLDFDALNSQLAANNDAMKPEVDCKALPPGHRRRIFYGNPNDDNFGLGYEEVDAWGNSVPGTFVPVSAFDPDRPTVCVKLAPGNQPVEEVWELVNLTGEDHNFHIHQTRFTVLQDPAAGAIGATETMDGSQVAYDNLPVRHGKTACLTVQAWRDAQTPGQPGYQACDGAPVRVRIPFAIAGDFVYHCHILEHEDGGMMARIRVRAYKR
jgi:FtsP/CotA-like multicopper oxidase with cupredoxin domain